MIRSATLRLAAVLALGLFGLTAQAQTTYFVSKAGDTDDGMCDADCSLREAIAAANLDTAADTIRFVPSLVGATIAFAPGHGALTITESLVIDGAGLDLTVDAKRQDRVFLLSEASGSHVRIELIGLTITGGLTAGNGGGVGVEGLPSVQIIRCVVTRNEALGNGGGVEADFGNIEQSTISDNVAGGSGGGVLGGTRFNVRSSTVSGNRAAGSGGGIIVFGESGGTNVTITRNEAGAGGGGVTVTDVFTGFGQAVMLGNTVGGDPQHPTADCGGPGFGFGINGIAGLGTTSGCIVKGSLITVDPEEAFTHVLDPLLADNGGETPTHVLLVPEGGPSANPAIDRYSADFPFICDDGDQRGFPAPFDGDSDGDANCDVGAVELNGTDLAPAVTLTLVPADTAVVIPAAGGPVTFTATLTNTTGETQTMEAWAAAVLPNNKLKLPVFGPVSVTLVPGQTLSRMLVQTVPGIAPAGSYTYAGYVGTFGGLAVLDRDTFGGTKAAGRTSDGSSDWTVLDAATGEPIEAGDVWHGEAEPVASSSSAPAEFGLSAAYPNPFRSQTEVTLAMPTASEVRLAVYDVLGRRVAMLVDGEVEAGTHRVRFDGAGLPSGVYLVRAEAEGFVQTQRVTVVR